ncbi:MAG: hypothetical protein ACW99J_19165 [Candidatus Thorarchaeota archaeon]|jgi:hypothetical protein
MLVKERFVTDNKIVVVEITEHDRIVDYDDILNAVSVEEDDWTGETPWDNSDGYEHTTRSFGYHDDEGIRESRGYARCDRNSVLIEIDDATLEMWGNYDYYHNAGCSKQVARELVAQTKREALDRLVEWYVNGWTWYYVSGEYAGYNDSVGGVDCRDHAEELRYEIADEIASDMEVAGYIIENRHNPHEYSKREQLQNKLNWNKKFAIVSNR